MSRNVSLRLILALTFLVGLAGGSRGLAGDQPAAPPSSGPEVIGATPTPVTSSAPETASTQTLVLPTPAPYVLPQPGWPTLAYPYPDPLLDRPDGPPPGWFTNVETTLVFPYFRNQLKGYVTNEITGNLDQISFTGNPFNATVMPRLEVGYRLTDGWGGVMLGYRGLSTQGSDIQVTSNFTLPPSTVTQQGRLDFNIMDLTYVSHEYSLRPNWNFRAGVGFRVMTFFFDSRIQVLSPPPDVGGPLGQGESNHFYAFGGWAFVELERHTPLAGLNFYGRVEGQDLYSRLTQHFNETVFAGTGAPVQAYYTQGGTGVTIPELRGIVGLSYTAPKWNNSRFILAYQYESFFQVARLTTIIGGTPPAIDDRGQLNLQGLVLRAEFNF
jgi:hypothetical protein